MDFGDDTKQSFYGHFQETQAGLEAQIENLSSTNASLRPAAIDACLASISQLSDVVKDASSYLPPYDQRSYSEQIRALSEKLSEARKALTPKQKFSFKNRRKDPTVSIGGAFSVTSASHGPTSTQSKPSSAAPEADNLVISSKRLEHITLSLSSTTSPVSFSSLLLSNLDHCIITSPLTTTLFSSAAIKNTTTTILHLGGCINGPLHLTGLSNVVLVVACRQLRMHEAHNVDVYILCPSRPIIEDCTNIRFAPLSAKGLGGKGEVEGANRWDQVDDFKWLKSEHSPNWRVLPEEERVEGRVWEEVGSGQMGRLGVEETLDRIVGKTVGIRGTAQ